MISQSTTTMAQQASFDVDDIENINEDDNGNNNGNFEVYIRSITGKTMIIYTNSDETIFDLKQKIFEKEGIPTQQQRLIFKDKNLSEDNEKNSFYGINIGATLNLAIRLADNKLMIDDDDDKDELKDGDNNNNNNYVKNKSWFKLQDVDNWRPFDPFISSILSCRYHQKVYDKKFALFSNEQRYIFQFEKDLNDKEVDGSHRILKQIYEPNNYYIEYGYIDAKSRNRKKSSHLIRCDIPNIDEINKEIELLHLLNTNKSAISLEIYISEHLQLLPHPNTNNEYLFGTWFGELIYSFKWMKNQQIKLQNFIIKDNINSIIFKQKYLKNKKLFKQIIKTKCGIPFGIAQLLYNKLIKILKQDIITHSSNDVYQFINDFLNNLMHEKIVEIQLIFMQNKIDSMNFFNQYLKDNNYTSDIRLTQFLKDILCLKSSQIQELVPLLKSAFQINTNEKDGKKDKKQTDENKFNINKNANIIKKKAERNKSITSFNIWLGRNVIYSKQKLIKQQNSMKTYILKQQYSKRDLQEMGKKEFVKQLHTKCQIPIGPLNLLYDDLPIDILPIIDDDGDEYHDEYDSDDDDDNDTNGIIEFISNYLYQLRSNDVQRIRDRCIESNINDDQFVRNIVPNKDNELYIFLKETIKIRNDNKLKRLIPQIQKYAQNLYPDIDIIDKDKREYKSNNNHNNNEATFGSWISQLCFERNKLTKQHVLIEQYLNDPNNNINGINDLDEWKFKKLLTNEFNIKSIDATDIMEKLFIYHTLNDNQLNDKKKLIEASKKILYDRRTDIINNIISKCNYCASMGIDDEYFLNEIVVNDSRLEKFLIHNICIDESIDDIPELISNIRQYLENLNVIKSRENEGKQQEEEKKEDLQGTIYGNKVGRWIGEIIHDRLIYLKYAKMIYDFIIINKWDSGILSYIGKKVFIDRINEYIHNQRYNKGLNDIWDRLKRRYIDNQNGGHESEKQVAKRIYDIIQELRRANIYQISVECMKDAECVDAKTFYTKIGSNKNILRKFIDKILKNTNQLELIETSGNIIYEKELIIERIYYFLSIDVDDNNIKFEDWLSNLIYDPVNLWLNTTQVNNFLVEENIESKRAKTWGKDKFIQTASIQCNSLNTKQLNKLWLMSKTRSQREEIFESVSEDYRRQNKMKMNKLKDIIKQKNINKLSFLNVTAIDIDKLFEFMDKDLNIKYNFDTQQFVNNIIEKLRLCLKIHTNLFDNKFHDNFNDALKLYNINIDDKEQQNELKIDDNKPKEKKIKKDPNPYNDWIRRLDPEIIKAENLNKYQLSLSICCKLLEQNEYEQRVNKIYDNIQNLVQNKRKSGFKDFNFNGQYMNKYIITSKKQYDIDKTEREEKLEQDVEKQKNTAQWKFKTKISELSSTEMAQLMGDCLLNNIPSYKTKIDNIYQKIIDSNMSGNIFISNLENSKNVFVHRLMECFADKSNRKFVERIYDDLTNQDIFKNIGIPQIKEYNALQLAEYLKTYQMTQIEMVMIDEMIDGKEFNYLKRHEFASKIKLKCGLSKGIGTMLYKSMKTYKFINKSAIDQNVGALLLGETLREEIINPCIEFISLTQKTLNIDKPFTNLLWNDLMKMDEMKELNDMTQDDLTSFIYGYPINQFYDKYEEQKSMDEQDKDSYIDKLVSQCFGNIGNINNDTTFYGDFKKIIAKYFVSEVLLIIFYRKRHDLLTDHGITYVQILDYNNITYDKLYKSQDEIKQILLPYRPKDLDNVTIVNGIIKEITNFIQTVKRSETKPKRNWTTYDIGLYLVKQICHQISIKRKNVYDNNNSNKKDELCITDIILCFKYLLLFIEEIGKNEAQNSMTNFMNRQRQNGDVVDENGKLFELNMNPKKGKIPLIVVNIFTKWVKQVIPQPQSLIAGVGSAAVGLVRKLTGF